ncbi:hypothetical protein [Vibrio neptunius]|uniref:Uncharacterized protein n=1 Tax=Vibrio neptunius TaxID=170651 RepID=A0ABS3A938_9VIBR|nr:hypothetical protein [Vibrio neptunius]MBN3495728.1 hypothetical protein [Vibrio neptunius]MBN3518152.1 hypothetical protein [Vibrio neptunius]MBN3552505.1 hypothetical protein [Vibrio neptunius]MBN3580545.1 hypothetical protein [Vibrio neptunius]MCH9874212.1 hypothetical protein [Vibrio neptunius]
MMPSQLNPSEKGLCAQDFYAVARALDGVVFHPPCVFIKSDHSGDVLGWAISVFSPPHQEALYLVSQDRELALFPDLHEAMLFLQHERIFTFTVSCAI